MQGHGRSVQWRETGSRDKMKRSRPHARPTPQGERMTDIAWIAVLVAVVLVWSRIGCG